MQDLLEAPDELPLWPQLDLGPTQRNLQLADMIDMKVPGEIARSCIWGDQQRFI